MGLSRSDAEGIWWCLEMPDAVHAAGWTRGGGGWLTTLVEAASGEIVCHHQMPATIGELRDGLVKPWRDRGMFGAPVCEVCEDDVDETQMLIEMAHDWGTS